MPTVVAFAAAVPLARRSRGALRVRVPVQAHPRPVRGYLPVRERDDGGGMSRKRWNGARTADEAWTAARSPGPSSASEEHTEDRAARVRRRSETAGVLAEKNSALEYNSAQDSTPETASLLPSARNSNLCSVCSRHASLLLRDVPYHDLPLTLRMKLHFEKYPGSSCAIIVLADMLADLSVANILRMIDGPADFAAVVAGFLAAFALADLASGVGTWFTFNFLTNGERACYCEGTRDFAMRIATNCGVVLPFLTLLLMDAPGDPLLYSFLVYFLSFVSVIPALVDWSGTSSFPPSVARAMRRIGVALGDHPLQNNSLHCSEIEVAGVEQDSIVGGMFTSCNHRSMSRPQVQRHRHSFLNRAWHSLLAEGRFFSRLEKLIFVISRGKLVPHAWRDDPAARLKAFAADRKIHGPAPAAQSKKAFVNIADKDQSESPDWP